MKNRLLFQLLLLAALLPLLIVSASASTAQGTLEFKNWETDETTTGTWSLDNRGTLTVEGSGVMRPDHRSWPWDSLREEIRTVVLKEGVTDTGYHSFDNCPNLTTVSLPATMEQITDGASAGPVNFLNCPSLISFQVAGGNPSMFARDGVLYTQYGSGGATLYLCPDGKETLDIPSSVTTIGFHALDGCEKLRELTVPAGVSTIYGGAFANCTSLKAAVIQGNANDGNYYFWNQFDGCSSLTSISLPSFHPEYTTRDGVLYSKDMTSLITCPGGKTSLTIPASVTSVCSLGKALSLTSLSVEPGSQTFSVRDNLLLDKAGTTVLSCPGGLKEVTIPEGITAIGEDAFEYAENLTRVTIPVSVTKIDKRAFDRTGLTDVFYEGSHDQWEKIDLMFGNEPLQEAGIRFGVVDGSGVAACGILTDIVDYGDPVQWTYYAGDAPGLNISGEVSAAAPVVIAFYDENGRMTDVRILTGEGSAEVRDGDHVRLFWLVQETFSPKGKTVDLSLKE